MASTIMLTGISGQPYGFAVCDVNLPWNPVPALYAFVDANGFPKYIGETESLAKRQPGPGHEKWAEAQRYGAVAVVARLSSRNESIRKTEEADLIRAYSPPANVQRRPAAGFGFGLSGLAAPVRRSTLLSGK